MAPFPGKPPFRNPCKGRPRAAKGCKASHGMRQCPPNQEPPPPHRGPMAPKQRPTHVSGPDPFIDPPSMTRQCPTISLVSTLSVRDEPRPQTHNCLDLGVVSGEADLPKMPARPTSGPGCTGGGIRARIRTRATGAGDGARRTLAARKQSWPTFCYRHDCTA